MPILQVLVENLLLCVALPLVLRMTLLRAIATLDDRGMFLIPLCHWAAMASGLAFAAGVLLAADLLSSATPAQLWRIDGPWHETRLATLLVAKTNVARDAWHEAWQMGFERSSLAADRLPAVGSTAIHAILTVSVGLTALNGTIAVLGWRSWGALRGLLAHLLIASGACAGTLFALAAGLWVLHWLNFWVFLVLLIFIEIRRREDRGMKLSY